MALICTSLSSFARRNHLQMLHCERVGHPPSDKPAPYCLPQQQWEPSLLLVPLLPGLDLTYSSCGGGHSSLLPSCPSSGKIQERDLCAITVRIRAWSHSVPAVWMDEGCVDTGSSLVVSLRGPSQESFCAVDPGTFIFVFSCLSREG